MNSYHELPEYRLLRRAQRLQRLINHEGNGVGMRVDFFDLLQPSSEDTPSNIDVDETPRDLDADADEGDENA